MRLRDAILLALMVGFLIIGIHQVMTLGVGKGYWALMLTLVLFFVYNLGKKRPEKSQDGEKSGKTGKSRKQVSGK